MQYHIFLFSSFKFIYIALIYNFFVLGINAMNCINEILSKKFIPAEYESFLLQMFQQTFKLLQLITSSSSNGVVLASVDETYDYFHWYTFI